MKLSTRLSIPFLFCSVLPAATQPDAVRVLATSPLRFEPAADDDSGQFIARGSRVRFSFTARQAVLESTEKNVRLQFQGAAPSARIEGVQKLESTTGLFLGNDPSKWRPSIPNYGRLQVHGLYSGIDLIYYGNEGELEYDLTIQPGADPHQIRLRLDGSRASVDHVGNLVAGLIQKRPVAYQVGTDGLRVPVESRYCKNRDGSYGFALGRYDHTRELVIDPVLTFSIYLTGNGQNIIQAIGIDKLGFIWVAGTTVATNLPVANHIQATNGGASDLFVVKINPDAKVGAQILFYTYLGGNGNDTLGGMAVGPNGDVYLTGSTQSSNFPTHNPVQSALKGTSDAFVVWINTSRTLGYSSYLGGTGTDSGVGITYNSKGKIFVTGGTASTDFTVTGGFQTANAGQQDAFVAEIDPSLSGSATLAYSTYLGGSGWDIGRGIAVAPDGTLWVAGGTYSHNFPQRGNSYQRSSKGAGDAFVAHINPAAGSSALEYTTYLGGAEQDEAKNVLVDPAGQVIVSGWTLSPNFPTTQNAFQTEYGGNADAFVSILDTTKTPQLVYSTFFGGSAPDVPFDLKQDAAGNLYLAGFTMSAGLPTTPNAAQSAFDLNMDAFALRFDPATAGPAGISYLSYLGSDGLQVGYGIDFDAKGDIYLVGYTSGPIFGALHGVPKTSSPGAVDGFIAGLPAK